jgi:hypothetical protein
MQSTNPAEVADRLAHLANDSTASAVTRTALDHLENLFAHRNGVGVQMASRAMQIAIPTRRVEAVSVAYMAALTNTYDQTQDR